MKTAARLIETVKAARDMCVTSGGPWELKTALTTDAEHLRPQRAVAVDAA